MGTNLLKVVDSYLYLLGFPTIKRNAVLFIHNGKCIITPNEAADGEGERFELIIDGDRSIENDAVLNIVKASGAIEFFENHDGNYYGVL